MSAHYQENLVSVIIPVYNRPTWIEEALQSVRDQTWPHWEVILCDDGSAEETASYLDRRAEPDRVRVLHLAHQGPGPARESGRQLARGEFIQYLDSDDLLAPRKFEIQVAALQRRLDCGVAYGITRLINEDGNVLRKPYKMTAEPQETLFPRLLVERWWCTHTPLYRRELCDRVGPWSDLRYSQDWEYDGRVGALGTKLAFCPEHVSDHRTHSGIRQTGSGKWLKPRNQVRFFESLLRNARKAGVGDDEPEMKHFVRWVFYSARKSGALGDFEAAQQCFALAVEANGTQSSPGLIRYRCLVNVLGWRFAGLISCWISKASQKHKGSYTLSRC